MAHGHGQSPGNHRLGGTSSLGDEAVQLLQALFPMVNPESLLE